MWREKTAKRHPVHASIQRIVEGRVVLSDPLLQIGWQAFCKLSNSRQIAFGAIGAIPFTQIAAFATLYAYKPGSRELEELIWCIQTLDDEYLTYQREQRQREAAAKKKEPPRGSNRTSRQH